MIHAYNMSRFSIDLAVRLVMYHATPLGTVIEPLLNRYCQ